jgi:hypothetical protein
MFPYGQISERAEIPQYDTAFDEEDASGTPLGVCDWVGEPAASAAE